MSKAGYARRTMLYTISCTVQREGTEIPSLFLLCKSFRKASASGTKQRDLQHFVGDAAGIMPVCFGVGCSHESQTEPECSAAGRLPRSVRSRTGSPPA